MGLIYCLNRIPAASPAVPDNIMQSCRLSIPLVARWVLQGQRGQKGGPEEEGGRFLCPVQQLPSSKVGGEPLRTLELLLSHHLASSFHLTY